MKSEIIITDNELPTVVVKAIAQGRKIEAIKLLREATGLGLANAKVLVDRVANRNSQMQSQAGGLTEESNTGRLLKVLLLLALAFAIWRYVIDA